MAIADGDVRWRSLIPIPGGIRDCGWGWRPPVSTWSYKESYRHNPHPTTTTYFWGSTPSPSLTPKPIPHPPGSIQNPCDSAFLSGGITMVLGRLKIVAAVKQRAGLSLYLIWSNSLSTCDMSHDLYVVAMIVIHWLELKIRCSAIPLQVPKKWPNGLFFRLIFLRMPSI